MGRWVIKEGSVNVYGAMEIKKKLLLFLSVFRIKIF